MISVLITGFEPFGGRDRNLSWDVAAKAASCDSFKDWVNAVRLPVSFRKVTEIVSGLLQYMKPDVMLMLGMAAKRERISVERLAVNLQDARIPDNEGFLPVDRPIFPDGENALFSTLPAKSIASAINDTGIDAAVSESGDCMSAILLSTLPFTAQEQHILRSDSFTFPTCRRLRPSRLFQPHWNK